MTNKAISSYTAALDNTFFFQLNVSDIFLTSLWKYILRVFIKDTLSGTF